MANTYSWTINKLDVRPTQDSLTDVVYNIHWTYVAISDQKDTEGNFYKTELIGTSVVSSPEASQFTPFEELTKNQVVGWLEEDASIANIQQVADDNLNELINPTSISKNAPWQ